MTQSFEKATVLERLAEDRHRLIVPDGWQQGRGAFGGLVFGLMMEAMGSREAEAARSLRAFTGEICGPALSTETVIHSRLLRRGRNQTNVTATLEQDGQAIAHASCVLAAARKVSPVPHLTVQPPTRVPFEQAEVVPVEPPIGPVFAQHYEYRPTGALPYSGSTEALVLGWIREKVPLSKLTAAALLGRLDAWFPANYVVDATPRPTATVSFMAELLANPADLDPTLPMFYRGRAIAQAGGYVVETRELWQEDHLIALNQQSFAILAESTGSP